MGNFNPLSLTLFPTNIFRYYSISDMDSVLFSFYDSFQSFNPSHDMTHTLNYYPNSNQTKPLPPSNHLCHLPPSVPDIWRLRILSLLSSMSLNTEQNIDHLNFHFISFIPSHII